MELVRTVGRNTLFGAAATLVNYAAKLVVAPLAIHHLGLEGFGVWAIVIAVVSYSRIGIAGTEAAFQKYVAEATATGDFGRASRLLSTGGLAIVAISTAIGVPLIAWSGHLVRAAGVPEQFITAAAHSVEFLVAAIIIANLGGVYRAVIMGGHRLDHCRRVEMGSSVLEGIASVVMLSNGCGLYSLTVPFAAGELLRCLVYLYLSRRVLPGVQLGAANVSRSVVRELGRYAGTFHIQSTLDMFLLSLLPVAILKLFGATAAGVYAASIRLVEVAALFPESLLLPLLSGSSLVCAEGSLDRVRAVFRQALRAATSLAIPALVFLAVLGDLVFAAWTGETSPMLITGLRLLCVAVLCRAIARVCMIIYRTTGRSGADIVWMGLRLGVLLAAGAAGVRLWGYEGALAAAAAAEFTGMCYMLLRMRTILRAPHLRWLLEHTATLVLVSTILVTVSVVISQTSVPWSIDGRMLAILRSGLAFAAFALITAVVLWRSLAGDERGALLGILTPAGGRGPRDVGAGAQAPPVTIGSA